MTSRNLAQQIYNYLNKNIKTLPVFYFQIGQLENNSFIFSTDEINLRYYQSSIIQFSWDVRSFFPKLDHVKQLDQMNEVVALLTSKEFKNLTFENYKIKLTLINDKENPPASSINIDLESYAENFQAYRINLKIYLEKEK